MTLDFQRWSAVRALGPCCLVSLMTDQPSFLDPQSVQRRNDPSCLPKDGFGGEKYQLYLSSELVYLSKRHR